MFRVKICGITSVDDARMAVDAGADAIGLNFFATSPRYCPPEVARAISKFLGSSVCKAGVFVNASVAEIAETSSGVELDLVQLHGDEPPGLIKELAPWPVMRAIRLGDDPAEVGRLLTLCRSAGRLPRMVLVDALQPGKYGGTGATTNWPAIAANRVQFAGLPLILAGGLNAANVASAIELVRPWGVDTASGVEVSPGKKSAEQMQLFVAAAREALVRAAKSR